jgi:hypothetical protein
MTLLRGPLRGGGGGKSSAATVFVPPPVGGLNTLDTLSGMQPTDAVMLENLIPDDGYVRARYGLATWATMPAGVTPLLQDAYEIVSYNGLAGLTAGKIFFITDSDIWDITAGGAIGGGTGVAWANTGRIANAQITNASGSYLYITAQSGITPKYYDGSNWNNTAFTGSGLTVSDLGFVALHMNRLWFAEGNSLNAWYGPTSAISGTLTKFPLGGIFRRGGELILIGSLSRDGGSGPDDLLVFITSNGEMAVYAGTDPSSSSSSALVGIFEIGAPLAYARNPMRKFGGDLLVGTQAGVVSLLKVMGGAPGGSRATITDKVGKAYRTGTTTSVATESVQIVDYPKQDLLIVAARSDRTILALNTKTNAWCTFTDFGQCFHVSNVVVDEYLYMAVAQASTSDPWLIKRYDVLGTVAQGVDFKLVHAFSGFNNANRKRFLQARPRIHTSGASAPPIHMCLDYNSTLPSQTVVADTSTTVRADWAEERWSANIPLVAPWQGVHGIGFTGAPALNFEFEASGSTTQGSVFIYNGCDVTFKTGGNL